MILRWFLFALMGIALVGFGVFGWRAIHQTMPPAQVVAAAPAAPPVMLNFLIAAHDIAPDSFLQPGDIATASIAQGAAPPNAWRDTPAIRAQLAGALVRRAISHEAVLDPSDLLLAGEHGFLAAILTPGMRAYTIPSDQVVTDAGLIWPGDRLDLILTQDMPHSMSPDHAVSAETVLVNLRVLAIDRQLVQPPAPTGKSGSGNSSAAASGAVTVEVSPADAERLAVALHLGKVAFAVRSTIPGLADGSVARVPAMLPPPGSTTWAGAVLHSLDQARSPPVASSVHVFEGDGDKEYKF